MTVRKCAHTSSASQWGLQELEGQTLFRSFFMGGFECSSHCRPCGTRLDLIAATKHDTHAALDYERLRERDLLTARDGARWHLIERRPGYYDFSTFTPLVRAAREAGVQVIWDLCHYGCPDYLDIFAPEFVDRFAEFAAACARVVRDESSDVPFYSVMNEISFFSWAGGEHGVLSPFEKGRGFELKQQLVRANIAAIDAVRDVDRRARFVQIDPIIHIVTSPEMPAQMKAEAESYRRAQYQGWDMIAGRVCPELGGSPDYLDILGANYYVHNQWVYGGKFIERTDARYKPLWRMLEELWKRYEKPVFLAETGIEDERRPEWLQYVTGEVMDAIARGVPVHGICLYPIVNHPGWADDRHCHNGLWDYCNDSGERNIYIPLADELKRQQIRMEAHLAALGREHEFLHVSA